MSSNLKSLITKLNNQCRTGMEQAATYCMQRTHYEVDLEHLLVKLLELDDSDIKRLMKRYQISVSAVESDLETELQGFKTGNTRTPVLSTHLPKLLEHAWLIASVEDHTSRVRSGHLLLAMLTEPELSQIALRVCPQWQKISLEELKHKLIELTANSPEAAEAAALAQAHGGHGGLTSSDAGAGEQNAQNEGKVIGKTPFLDQYTVNLTQRARDGSIDPVLGRDTEIRQMVDVLTRRRQNNPILTGEAGVGKTAVVEGLAQRIALGDIPPPLKGVALHMLDMGLLQAGASVKGEFEARLKGVIDEVKRSPHPVILFIDEAHTMIGAGGQAGQNDAANLLKPALARGELRTIAATTWSEYKKYFEKDAALARRFQVIKVEEPDEETACTMLRGLVDKLETHFNVRVLEEAIRDAVSLSHRYITGRQLPDKAVSVLDTACARVALGQNATPAVIEDDRKRLEVIQVETEALSREAAVGAKVDERQKELSDEKASITARLAANEIRWKEENALVTQMRALRTSLEQAAVPAATTDGKTSPAQPSAAELKAQRKQLAELADQLIKLQGQTPLVPLCVDGQIVGEVISGWTGIPLGKMVKDEILTVQNLHLTLGKRVVGQDHAIAAVAQRVRTARAQLEDPNKPKGVFLFVGPSGVGKTETALALADILYGGEHNIITINMSEFQEAHTVSSLKGSPPGYVGYGEGGVLTEAVRRKPYSVVLLDEVEKAHPDVLELFFQVFDKGVMDDAEGREIDFKNTLIILTSNVGTQAIMSSCLNKTPEELPDSDALAELIKPQLFQAFKPAFLGRMKVIPYYPLPDAILEGIIRLKMDKIVNRVAQNHRAVFEYDDSVVEAVLARCTEVDSGARNVDHILNGSLLPEIAGSVLDAMGKGKAIKKIKVSTDDAGQFKYAVK